MAEAYSTRNVTVAAGDALAVFEVDRSGTRDELNAPGSVAYKTQDVTAKEGADYSATHGELTFAAGETRKQVSVAVHPKAPETGGRKDFVLHLRGFGTATATITEGQSKNQLQAYWLVPGAGEATAIPTATTAGAAANAQMDVSNFSDPPSGQTMLPEPQSYLRIGYARADMNDYERVIAESDDFFARRHQVNGTVEKNSDKVPKEPGAMRKFARPRNVNRDEEDWENEQKKGNKHLDGIFLYTSGNLTTSTRGTASYVIGGDYVHHVGGETRLNYMGEVTRTYLSKSDGLVRLVEGVANLGAMYLDYEIKRTYTLEFAAEMSVKYALGVEFSLTTGAKIEVSNDLTMEVRNGAKLEVVGIDLTGKLSLTGSYDAYLMGGEFASTKSEDLRSATKEIVLQIDPAGGWKRSAAVAAYVLGNEALMAAATAVATFPVSATDDELNNLADHEARGTIFTAAMDAVVPATFAQYGVLGMVVLGLLKVSQKVAAIAPSPTPRIKMTPTEMEFAIGSSTIKMTPDEILMTSMKVRVGGPAYPIVFPLDLFEVASGKTEIRSGQTKVNTVFEVGGTATFRSDVSATGNVSALNIRAGV